MSISVPYLESAANTIYSAVKDPSILSLCRRRQEELDGEEHRRRLVIEQEEKIAEQKKKIAEQEEMIARLQEELNVLKVRQAK